VDFLEVVPWGMFSICGRRTLPGTNVRGFTESNSVDTSVIIKPVRTNDSSQALRSETAKHYSKSIVAVKIKRRGSNRARLCHHKTQQRLLRGVSQPLCRGRATPHQLVSLRTTSNSFSLWQDCGRNKWKLAVTECQHMSMHAKTVDFARGCNSNQNQ
jgi:hypothetical protein